MTDAEAIGKAVQEKKAIEGELKTLRLKADRYGSPKHLGRYADEFTFRLNDGNVRHPWDRLDSFVDAIAGKRLTYRRLTQ
jgi:hypothetical protein